MKKKMIAGLLLLLCVLLIVPTGAFAASSGFKYNYPGNDTGRSIGVMKDGSMYVIFLSGDHAKLVSFSPDGKIKWSVNGPSRKEMYMAFDDKGRVYTVIGTKVTAYDLKGAPRWSKTFKENVNITGGKGIISAHTQFSVWAYDYDGKEVYKANFDEKEMKTVYPDNGSGFWSTKDGITNDIYKDKQKLFSIKNEPKSYFSEAKTSPDGKTIYLTESINREGKSSFLLAYDLKGKLLWKTAMEPSTYPINSFTILNSGVIVTLHNMNRSLSGIDASGKVLWTQKPIVSPLTISSFQNLVYVGNDIYDASGKIVQTVTKPDMEIYVGDDGSMTFYNSSSLEKVNVKYADVIGE